METCIVCGSGEKQIQKVLNGMKISLCLRHAGHAHRRAGVPGSVTLALSLRLAQPRGAVACGNPVDPQAGPADPFAGRRRGRLLDVADPLWR